MSAIAKQTDHFLRARGSLLRAYIAQPVLQTTIESGNEHDRFAVAATEDNNTVGHTSTARNLQSGVVLSSAWRGDSL